MAKRLWDWQVFQPLASSYSAKTVRLSGDSLALFLSTEGLTEFWRWSSGGDTPDATEQDAIEALVALAYEELMVNPLIGTIQPYATAFPPAGMLQCDGSTHLRVDYPDLYAALDTPFIVDADHFKTPDMRGLVAIGAGTAAGSGTVYNPGDTGGEEKHLLTTSELTEHNHAVIDGGHAHGVSDPGHNHTLNDPGHNHTLNNPTHNHTLTDPGHVHTVTDPGHVHVQGNGRGTAAGAYQSGTNSGNFTTPNTNSETTGVSVDSHTTGVTANAAAAGQTANAASTGVTLAAASTGVTVQGHVSAISIADTGNSQKHENRQPYLALKMGIWAT